MRDPKLIETPAQRIPDEWRRHYLQRPIEKLPGDVAIVFDRWFKLNNEKDQLRADLIEATSKLRFANWQVWALELIVLGEGCVIGWIVKAFLSAHIK